MSSRPMLPAAPAALAALGLAAGVCVGFALGGGLRSAASVTAPAMGVSPAPGAAGLRALPGPLAVTPLRVIDGDTFEARASVWFGHEVVVLVRVRGVDAPELRGRCQQETARARDAADALRDILASGPVVLTDLSPDKYHGRVVASAWVANKRGVRDPVGDLLVAGGYARPYDGRARASWCA